MQNSSKKVPGARSKNQGEAVHQCAFVPWFQFKQCQVTTCKNHTTALESGCIAVGRVVPEGTKVISDEEIKFFKFHSKKISTRLVSTKRKEATDRVRAVLVLREFIKYIVLNHHVPGEQPVFTYSILKNREKRYPLKIKQLGFENWMWEHILDEATFAAFKRSRGGECSSLRLQDLLALDDAKWSQFQKKLAGIFFTT